MTENCRGCWVQRFSELNQVGMMNETPNRFLGFEQHFDLKKKQQLKILPPTEFEGRACSRGIEL
jgi:hypothetical protein